MPIGQHMANLRRKGGLGKDAERARTRAEQLTAIDPDWACPWPLDWQRHHRILAQLAETETGGVLPAIEPGVIFDGDDLGRWLTRQTRDWAQLSPEQQERLSKLGVQTAEAPAPAPAAVGAAGRGRVRRSRRSSGAWRLSRSGWSGKAWAGPCRGATARPSPSTARRSR